LKPGALVGGVVCLVAFSALFETALASPRPLANNCPGGRYVTTVEVVQHQNWIQNSPTVFDRKESYVRLPAWLGRLTILHASQGFLLSGEERLGQWTKVTVPPSVTITMRIFGKPIYWPITLPVTRDIKACRDEKGDLYVR
jgi:hypothetical protein